MERVGRTSRGAGTAIAIPSALFTTHFPWRDADDKQRARVRDLAQAALNARAKFPGASMADLYDSDVMKPELCHAHRALDAAVDKLYRQFPSDRQRVEHLFTRYEKLVTPLTAQPKKRRGRASA